MSTVHDHTHRFAKVKVTWHDLVLHILHDVTERLSLLWGAFWQLALQVARLQTIKILPHEQKPLPAILRKSLLIHPSDKLVVPGWRGGQGDPLETCGSHR